jgi:predicted ATPase
MIEKIDFENFKRFKFESLNMEKPITLLYGENSSGKSSILKGFAALIQTFSWSRNKHEPLVAQGEYANLGIFKDYVHNHNTSNKITFSLTTMPLAWYSPFDTKSGKATKYITSLCYDRSPYTEQARIYSIVVSAIVEDGSLWEILKLKRAETKSYYTITTNFEVLKNEVSSYSRLKIKAPDKEIKRAAALKTKLHYTEGFTFTLASGKNDDISIYKIRVLDRFIYALFELPEKYKYLGPLRSSPSRSYTLSAASSDVGSRGENTPSVISYLKRSSESIKVNKEAYRKIQHWVNLLFPGRSIAVEDYEELVKLKITRDGIADSIQDVGFGFSQVLPIIVQAAALKKDQCMIIEQPELHLHPRAQVAFSQFLVEACREGKRFIIETHSEHVLRGLQLAISDNSMNDALGIKKEDLKVYYFPSEHGVNAFEIKINSDGELIDGWPSGFFDESYNLTKRIINNKIAKLAGMSHESSN